MSWPPLLLVLLLPGETAPSARQVMTLYENESHRTRSRCRTCRQAARSAWASVADDRSASDNHLGPGYLKIQGGLGGRSDEQDASHLA
ncbi:hypothetical protein CSOJ01_07714 [Colletotrichum sojae]|uniref:Uncharacterized protein n=1 Tax=Colletotrichum sojae TaxID=2175907 RepID=A0A8H6MTZ6_9PEZI|nr:hypothetical protein CSOJ01_07714 [Colletotrichum sojae]